jgi:hypothetical protein
MSKKIFKLTDFDSRACEVEVPVGGDSVLTLSLRKFTLLDRMWVEKEWGSLAKWESDLFPQTEVYNETDWLVALIKTTHRLIEGEHKDKFETWESLAGELESSVEILMNLQRALLYVMRGSEPLIDEYEKQVKKNLDKLNPKKKTKKRAQRAGQK